MGDRDPVVEEQAGDDRRAHAFALRLGLGGLIDDLVGAGDGVAQHDARARHAGLRIGRAHVLVLDRFLHQAHDGLDGDAARDLAGVVAAHAVGQHEQADVGIDADRVFVVLAHAADVAQPYGADLAAHLACPPRPRSMS